VRLLGSWDGQDDDVLVQNLVVAHIVGKRRGVPVG
jgi:hypothetical protein